MTIKPITFRKDGFYGQPSPLAARKVPTSSTPTCAIAAR